MAKQEVRRGRKFVEYHDPDTQDEHTFTQEISGADVSYQETVGGSWLPVNESWETDGQDGFSFRAHRMNHKVRFDSIGAWRWYPRRNVETEYIVINRPQCWLTATKRWGNLLVNGISREGRDITLTSVRKVTRVIHSRWNGIKTDWILLDSTAPTKFRQQINLVGLTELDGWLYGADGEKVALLTPTTAIGADGAELPCSGSYVDGYLQFEADVTGAVYPVTIDPDFSVQPDETAGVDTFMISTCPDTNYGTDTKISVYGTNYHRSLIKFDLSTLAGTTISAATLELTTTNDKYAAATLYIHRVLVGNTGWTEAGATWNKLDGTNAWAGSAGCSSSGTDYAAATLYADDPGGDANNQTKSLSLDTTEFTTLVSANYGMLLRIATNFKRKDWHSSSSSTASYRPKLVVTYTATGALRRTNMNAQMSNLTGGMHG